MHLEMAAKHDPELGQAWIRRLRDPCWTPSAFAFALSLVVSGIQRFEVASLAAMETRVAKAHADAGQCASTRWVPTGPPGQNNNARGQPANDAVGIETALIRCALNSVHGQGAVVHPLVNLSIRLMELKRGAGVQASAALGIRLLRELFAGHASCRRTILSTCTTKLIGSSEVSALPFIRLMSELVRRHPSHIESNIHEVRAALENVALLPPGAAAGLLVALWPLCQQCKDISDFLIVLLRKAMFRRELSARLLAARGFLLLIAEGLQRFYAGHGAQSGAAGPSCSQAAPVMSQMNVISGGGGGPCVGATMLHELMGFLRRCLTQQPEVRRLVYESLPALLAADPAASEPIAELILPHFASFCETNPSLMPPLKLEACALTGTDGTHVRIVEPLPHLMACVRAVLSYADGVDSDEDSDENYRQQIEHPDGPSEVATVALRKLFGCVCRRLRTCPLEDFNFDQSTCFDPGEAQGELSQATADILLGCYEVAMEDAVDAIQRLSSMGGGCLSQDDQFSVRSEGLASELLAFFQQHRRLSNLALEGMRGPLKVHHRVDGLTQAVRPGGRRSGGGGACHKARSSLPLDKRTPVMSTQCMSRLLTAIVDDGLVPGGCDVSATSPTATQSAHVKLARDVAFQAFIMAACGRVLMSTISGAGADLAASLRAAMAGTAPPPDALRGGVDDDAKNITALLFAIPDCTCLAGPLFRAIQTTVLARVRARTGGGGGPAHLGQSKKEKDPEEALLLESVNTLRCLLAAGGGTLDGVAGILRHVSPTAPGVTVGTGARIGSPEYCGTEEAVEIIASRTHHFKQMFEILVENACAKELEAMCSCVQMLADVLPGHHASEISQWVTGACNAAPTALASNPMTAKWLIMLRLRCADACNAASCQDGNQISCADVDLTTIVELGQCICASVDREQEMLGEDGAPTLHFSAVEDCPLLSAKSLNGIFLACIAHIDASIAQLEWAWAWLTAAANSLTASLTASVIVRRQLEENSSSREYGEALVAGQLRAEWERIGLHRMRRLVGAAAVLAKAKLQGPPLEAIAKSLVRLYKLLKLTAKSQLARSKQRQGPPSRALHDLISSVNVTLTPQVYSLITEVQHMRTKAAEEAEYLQENGDDENENENEANDPGKKPKGKGKNKISERTAAVNKTRKDARLLSELVFGVEQWEAVVIKISQVTKVNLMVNAKKATNRDFRITQLRPSAKRMRTCVTEANTEEGKDAPNAQAPEPEEEEEQEQGPGERACDDEEKDDYLMADAAVEENGELYEDQ